MSLEGLALDRWRKRLVNLSGENASTSVGILTRRKDDKFVAADPRYKLPLFENWSPAE
jgi:hypothetical protein